MTSEPLLIKNAAGSARCKRLQIMTMAEQSWATAVQLVAQIATRSRSSMHDDPALEEV
jgi:hypothetical protein